MSRRGRSEALCPKILASVSFDKTARLWDTTTGRERITLKGHNGEEIDRLAISPDGRTLATGSWDHTVKLWDVATGRERATLKGCKSWIYAVTFSDDGKVLAAGDRFDVKLWSVATGRELARISSSHVVAALSFEGAICTVIGGDRSIKRWDWRRRRMVASFGGSNTTVANSACSRDGKLAAVGGYDGMLRLVDLASGHESAALAGYDDGAPAFSPDGKLLASGSSDAVKVWSAAGARRERDTISLQRHRDRIYAMALSPDGRILVTGGMDGIYKLWGLTSGHEIATFGGHHPGVFRGSFAFSPDGKTLAAASYDRT